MGNALFFVLSYRDNLNQLLKTNQNHYQLMYLVIHLNKYAFQNYFHRKVKVHSLSDRINY